MKYRIYYSEASHRRCTVEADSLEEAIQFVEDDGDVDDDYEIDGGGRYDIVGEVVQ